MSEDSLPAQGRYTVSGALVMERPGREAELVPGTVSVRWDRDRAGVTLWIRDGDRRKRAALWLAMPGAAQLVRLLQEDRSPGG
jgi:hypothetical protein